MEQNKVTRYQELGYNNREDYLNSLADDYGVDPEAVYALADVLGESEDFDGLLAELADLEWADMWTEEEGE